jgi:hypothetical protein
MDTKSENLFDQYCKELGINSERIYEGDEQRPDYSLKKNGNICIAEVKEFVANDGEKKAIESVTTQRI